MSLVFMRVGWHCANEEAVLRVKAGFCPLINVNDLLDSTTCTSQSRIFEGSDFNQFDGVKYLADMYLVDHDKWEAYRDSIVAYFASVAKDDVISIDFQVNEFSTQNAELPEPDVMTEVYTWLIS